MARFYLNAKTRQQQHWGWGDKLVSRVLAEVRPQMHVKGAGHGRPGQACSPALGRQKYMHLWSSLASQPSLLGKSQASEDLVSKKQCGWHLRSDSCCCPLASPYAAVCRYSCIHKCAPIFVNLHMHAPTYNFSMWI